MADPTIAQSYPKELWGALVGTVTIIIGLVSILYNRLNSDIKGHDDSLEQGEKRFQVQGEKQERFSAQLEEILRRIKALSFELEKGSAEFKKLGEITTKIQAKTEELEKSQIEFKKIAEIVVKIQSKIEELEKENVFNEEVVDELKTDFKDLHDTLLKMQTEHKHNHPDSKI